ncbi:hypothetical protein AM506_12220 [Rossellomorea vietnamensis]|uniref:Glycosyltransferase n=2 Tax=Rossellomorea vietnamensis TaxID=218284 RepID=A0A0P6VW95_9BACI|nr:hypothetical protein AM506_12220 [Rossellomorea vietnamensis]
MALRLAKYYKVFYITLNSYREKKNQNTNFSWKDMEEEDNLYMKTSPFLIPFSIRLKIIRTINGYRVARQIRKILSENNIKEAELLIFAYTPISAEVIKHFPNVKVHYDCADDFTTWHGINRSHAAIYKEYEKFILERALSVSTASNHMYEKFVNRNKNVFYIPNGADTELFSHTNIKNEKLKQIQKPIIGFVGATSGFLDVDLIKNIALKRPKYSFVFVGPLEGLEESLRNIKNIYLLGRRPYEELGEYVNNFDVCMIPANKKPASVAADAAKLYQFLSSGNPVVSINLPEVSKHSDYVYLASNIEEFVSKIDVSLSEDYFNRDKRIAYSSNFNWDNTTDNLLKHLRGVHGVEDGIH